MRKTWSEEKTCGISKAKKTKKQTNGKNVNIEDKRILKEYIFLIKLLPVITCFRNFTKERSDDS